MGETNTLVLLFGIYALADGILGIWIAFTGLANHDHWWVLLLAGLAGVGIGLLTLIAPDVTTLVLLFYIAVWAIAAGLPHILAAIRLRQEIRNEWFLILGGAVSTLLGVVLIIRPAAGALALLWLIASAAIVYGLLLAILSLRIRKLGTVATAG